MPDEIETKLGVPDADGFRPLMIRVRERKLVVSYGETADYVSGGSGTITPGVTIRGGGTPTFSQSGMPTGAGISFNTSTGVFTLSSTTATGNHLITVTMSVDGATTKTSFTLVEVPGGGGSELVEGDLTYIGGARFSISQAGMGDSYMGNNPARLGYNHVSDTMWVGSRTSDRAIAEFEIPDTGDLVNDSDPSNLPIIGSGDLVQPFLYLPDLITAGGGSIAMNDSGSITMANGGNGTRIDCLMMDDDGKLVLGAWVYYDGGLSCNKTFVVFDTPSDLTTSDVSGIFPFAVHPATPGYGGFYGGYGCRIPSANRSALGSKQLCTGNFGISIQGRASWGASLFGLNTNDLSATPIPSENRRDYMSYDSDNPITDLFGLPDYDYTHAVSMNRGCFHGGCCFIDGTDTFLVSGSAPEPTGAAIGSKLIYGYPDKHGDYTITGSKIYGADARGSTPGLGGLTYARWIPCVWAYRISDIAAVVAGSKNPWEVKPYARWSIPFPVQSDGHQEYGHGEVYVNIVSGMMYRPSDQTLWVSQNNGNNDDSAILHAISIAP